MLGTNLKKLRQNSNRLRQSLAGSVRHLTKLKIALILTIALSLWSCGTQKERAGYGAGILPDNTAVERLVPVYLSPDSALLKAYFECDSSNQVIMRAYHDLKSKGGNSDLSFENGQLDYKITFVHDTIYIPGKDSLIYIPRDVPGPIVYKTTWWEGFWIRLGKLLSLIVLAFLAPKAYQLIKGRIK